MSNPLFALMLALGVAVSFTTSAIADECLILDLVDDIFKDGGTNEWNPNNGAVQTFDIFNATSNFGDIVQGTDGQDDIRISFTSNFGPTTDGVDYSGNTFANGTGLGSRIEGSSGPGTTNNNGTVSTQTICIEFLNAGWKVEADTNMDASISSANTIAGGVGGTNAWENASLQFLDNGGVAFTPTSFRTYANDRASQGFIGTGTYIADGDTQDDVGTDEATDDASGAFDDNSPSLDFSNAGIAGGTQIGGFKFTHRMTDTQGINDTGFGYTATINELNFKFTAVVPEPSGFALMGMVAVGCVSRRRRG